jgi:molybdopterin/thiamine biosynthesis adenylyltransferase
MTTDRYQRHSLIDWFSQDEVKQSSFAVIGCGATGNEVAKNLALLGVGKIDLFDFDTIEIHNLTRSVLFRESDVGYNKAEVASKRIKELDPNIDVNFFVGDFWDTLSLEKIQDYDCVLCCVDNFEARIKLNQLCLITSTNFINTGIDSKFSQVEVFPFSSGKHIACYECNLPDSAYERVQKRYSCGWLKKISYIEKKIPTTIITSSITGALAAGNALKLLNETSQLSGTRILTDSFTGRSTVSIVGKSDSCPSCASMMDNVSLLKGSATIEKGIEFPIKHGCNIITSEPILVSYRCTECTPNQEDSTVIFKKASDFDSSITTCQKCNNESIDVTIRDSFSTDELVENFSGMNLPVKFIRLDNKERTIIIELE